MLYTTRSRLKVGFLSIGGLSNFSEELYMCGLSLDISHC